MIRSGGINMRMKAGARLAAPLFILIASLCTHSAAAAETSPASTPFGHWETDPAGLPAFVYTMDQTSDPRALYPTSQGMSNDHFHLLGNGRMVAVAYNHGEVQIYSGERGATWLNERDPEHNRFAGGYGFLQEGDTIYSMRFPDRPPGCEYERRFGVGYFLKSMTVDGLRVTQTIYAPAGEDTVLVSKTVIGNLTDRPRELTWYEYWDVNPHYFGTMIEIAGEEGESTGEGAGLSATSTILFKMLDLIPGKFTLSRMVKNLLHGWRESATQDFLLTTKFEDGYLMATQRSPSPPKDRETRSEINYLPLTFFLTSLDRGHDYKIETRRKVAFDRKGKFTGRVENGLIEEVLLKKAESCLMMARTVKIDKGRSETLKFSVGYLQGSQSINDIVHTLGMIPSSPSDDIKNGWNKALPFVEVRPDWLDQEMLWHAYYLRAMATFDEYFDARTISQGCAYQYMIGLNIAARDPLQHMLPVVYLEPALAKDVLLYSLAEMDQKGFIPYGIKGVGIRTAGGNPFPSDTNLYLILALTEYVTATRDFGFMDEVLPYYPREAGHEGTVAEHMKKAWRHQIEDVGIGEHGLIKLRNSDWNDSFLAEEKARDRNLDMSRVEADAESVLNTAMAAYILPRFADLVRAHGDKEWADAIDTQARSFREALDRQWNGKWFNRAILPGGKVVGGDDRLYLSPQPWAILADALDLPAEIVLDENLHSELTPRSPLGATMRWPPLEDIDRPEESGTGTNGGVWYSLRFPLVMSYARIRPKYAWEEFIKMTLHNHASAYPDSWIGQWSGPDSYNAPQAHDPGGTWTGFPLSGGMSDFPVMCGHAHAAPWFSLIKLMGIHPDPAGFTIDPRMPEESFSLKTELIELSRGPGSIEGALTPLGPGKVRWRVRTAQKPARVTAGEKSVRFSMDGDFVVFETGGETGKRSEWRIELY